MIPQLSLQKKLVAVVTLATIKLVLIINSFLLVIETLFTHTSHDTFMLRIYSFGVVLILIKSFCKLLMI